MMDNEISRAIKQKLDAQLRVKNMDTAPSIWEGAGGSIQVVDPSAYTVPYIGGKNVTIGTSGGAKTINAVMNLIEGDGIQISEPDGNGAVEISAINTDAGSLLGKGIDIPTFAGKDGFVLAYNQTTGKFYLKEVTGGGETMIQFLQPITLIMNTQAIEIPFGAVTII